MSVSKSAAESADSLMLVVERERQRCSRASAQMLGYVIDVVYVDEFLLAATAQNLRELAKLIPLPAPMPA
jgi:hypothetical protein